MNNKLKKVLMFTFMGTLLHFAAFGKGWKAQWIEAQNCTESMNTWQIFRKMVYLKSKPHDLKACISVDSKYWLWINGKQVVFEGQLKRGPSPKDTYYDEVELAPYLKRGNNCIAVLTMYYGKEGFSHKSSGHAGFLFDAQGRGVEILSDTSWEADVYEAYGRCKIDVPNYRLPESSLCFDGQKDLGKWFSLAYGKHFRKAKVLNGQSINNIYGNLVKRPIPLFRFSRLKKYEWTKFDAEKRILHCKLPYNAQVTPWIKIKAVAGKIIDMRTEDFSVDHVLSVRGEYITRDGIQEYENLGWMNGNEVQYNIPEGVEVLDVKYRESGYDTDIAGMFECDDPYWNELWKRSARTMYVNMRDTYSDCPDRERAQWWGDIVNDIQEDFYVLSPSSWQIITKGMYELMNWQRSDGTIFSPIPAGNWNKELPVQMLASVGHYGFYTQYYNSGDKSFIAPLYNGVHKYLHGVWKVGENGFVKTRPGEWSWGDWGQNIDLDMITNEWYYLALSAERRFAEILGKKGDEADIAAIMGKMEQNFDNVYWTEKGYRSSDYKGMTDDRAQALAVVSGLAKPDKYPTLLGVLDTTEQCSPWMELYVQEALFKMGQGEKALIRAKERYNCMMSDKNATTVYEVWNRSGSINHAWSAGMTVIMGREVCGIRPTSPGFKTFEVAPQMAGLKWVNTRLQTKYGFIQVKLKQKGKQLIVNVSVPNETSAIVKWNGKEEKVGAGKHTLIL